MSENKTHFFAYILVFVVIFIIILFFLVKYNSFGAKDRMQEQKTKLLDSLDQRPRQLIIPNPPAGKEFCVVNEYTNVIGWDSINNCCVYQWKNIEHTLQTCINAQINGKTIYSVYDNNYVENYESYLEFVK